MLCFSVQLSQDYLVLNFTPPYGRPPVPPYFPLILIKFKTKQFLEFCQAQFQHAIEIEIE